LHRCTSILRRRGVAEDVAGGSRLGSSSRTRIGFLREATEEALMAAKRKASSKAKKKAPAKKKAAKKKK